MRKYLGFRLQQISKLPSDLRFLIERSRHAASLPEVPLPGILSSLAKEGIAVSTLEAIGEVQAETIRNNLRELMPAVHTLDPERTHGLTLPPYAAVMDPVWLAKNYPAVPLWGLQARLLDLMENFIGLPAVCMGASLRRDLPVNDSSGTRRWHLDLNDRRYPKIIIYLNDVDETGGPFQYIPQQQHRQLKDFRGRKSVSDEEMSEKVAPAHWQSVCGKAGTVIFVDTANVFHRGKLPQQERYTLFFSYASKRPKNPALCRRAHLHDSMLELSRLDLSDRQRTALFF